MGRYVFNLNDLDYWDVLKLGAHFMDRSAGGDTPGTRAMSAYDKSESMAIMNRYCQPRMRFHWREEDFREMQSDFRDAFESMVARAASKKASE